MEKVTSLKEYKQEKIREGEEMLKKIFDFEKIMDYVSGLNQDEGEIREILQSREDLNMNSGFSDDEWYDLLADIFKVEE